MNEQDYQAGRRALAEHLLGIIARDLPASEQKKAHLVRERAQVVQTLREICAKHGDNDWPDDLHLADVLDKHLMRHLESR